MGKFNWIFVNSIKILTKSCISTLQKFSELENFKLCQNNSNPLKSNKSTDTSDLDVVIKQENGAFEADVMVCSSEFTSRSGYPTYP